jgi:hypothetical protein
MTSIQLAAIAYRLGAIDNIGDQLCQLTLTLDDLQEGSLSVKLELVLKAFNERAAEHRSILNQYANEITIDSTPSGQGGQTTSHKQTNL